VELLTLFQMKRSKLLVLLLFSEGLLYSQMVYYPCIYFLLPPETPVAKPKTDWKWQRLCLLLLRGDGGNTIIVLMSTTTSHPIDLRSPPIQLRIQTQKEEGEANLDDHEFAFLFPPFGNASSPSKTKCRVIPYVWNW
jgi:hypothetical protein